MVCRARIDGARPGDKLIWACGGAVPLKESMLYYWDVTTGGHEKTMALGFSAEDCRSNSISLDGKGFTILSPAGKRRGVSVGSCSNIEKITIADAGAWSDPLALAASSGKELPLVCGTIGLGDVREVYWATQSFDGDKPGDTSPVASAAEAFASGMARAENIGKRVTVDTPDPWLNAAVGASSAVTDGVFRRGIFTHSGMRWACRFWAGVPFTAARLTAGTNESKPRPNTALPGRLRSRTRRCPCRTQSMA